MLNQPWMLLMLLMMMILFMIMLLLLMTDNVAADDEGGWCNCCLMLLLMTGVVDGCCWWWCIWLLLMMMKDAVGAVDDEFQHKLWEISVTWTNEKCNDIFCSQRELQESCTWNVYKTKSVSKVHSEKRDVLILQRKWSAGIVEIEPKPAPNV